MTKQNIHKRTNLIFHLYWIMRAEFIAKQVMGLLSKCSTIFYQYGNYDKEMLIIV